MSRKSGIFAAKHGKRYPARPRRQAPTSPPKAPRLSEAITISAALANLSAALIRLFSD